MIRQTARSFATTARKMAATPHMGIAQAQGIAKGLTGGTLSDEDGQRENPHTQKKIPG